MHVHSSASDGTDRPAEVMRRARAAGVDVVALTDHDTTAGLGEAARALPAGLILVPGILSIPVIRTWWPNARKSGSPALSALGVWWRGFAGLAFPLRGSRLPRSRTAARLAGRMSPVP